MMMKKNSTNIFHTRDVHKKIYIFLFSLAVAVFLTWYECVVSYMWMKNCLSFSPPLNFLWWVYLTYTPPLIRRLDSTSCLVLFFLYFFVVLQLTSHTRIQVENCHLFNHTHWLLLLNSTSSNSIREDDLERF